MHEGISESAGQIWADGVFIHPGGGVGAKDGLLRAEPQIKAIVRTALELAAARQALSEADLQLEIEQFRQWESEQQASE